MCEHGHLLLNFALRNTIRVNIILALVKPCQNGHGISSKRKLRWLEMSKKIRLRRIDQRRKNLWKNLFIFRHLTWFFFLLHFLPETLLYGRRSYWLRFQKCPSFFLRDFVLIIAQFILVISRHFSFNQTGPCDFAFYIWPWFFNHMVKR